MVDVVVGWICRQGAGRQARLVGAGSSADRQASTQHNNTTPGGAQWSGVVVWWVFAIWFEQGRLMVALTNTSASKDAALMLVS